METRYPIKFNKGKLVKYTKPNKYIPKFNNVTMDIDPWSTTKIKDILDWIEENNGDPMDATLEIGELHYNDYTSGEVTLQIPLDEKVIEAQEKEYQKLLKEYQEWVVLSKDARMTEEDKEKAAYAKSLKTQEQNLLNKLSKIRKQQEKL